MMYPEAIEVGGHEYPINTGYEYALACFRCIDDPELSDVERAYGVIGILFKEPPPDDLAEAALKLSVRYLQRGEEAKPGFRKKDMDFTADESFIKASFLSDYRIDLDESSMHWYKFYTLLQGLSDGSILNRVRDLRNLDTSTIKDPQTRQRIMQAQQDFALPDGNDDDVSDIADEFFAQLKD